MVVRAEREARGRALKSRILLMTAGCSTDCPDQSLINFTPCSGLRALCLFSSQILGYQDIKAKLPDSSWQIFCVFCLAMLDCKPSTLILFHGLPSPLSPLSASSLQTMLCTAMAGELFNEKLREPVSLSLL